MRISRLLTLLCSFVLLASAQQRTVYVLPNGQGAPNVEAHNADSLALLGLVNGASANRVISNPTGTRTYVLSPNAAEALQILNGASPGTTIRRLALQGPATSAALSADGTRVLLIAGTLYQFDIATDQPLITSVINLGSNPIDLITGGDARTAFVLSAGDGRLLEVDLNSNSVGRSLAITSGDLTGLSRGPNGFLYVTGSGHIYEIDPATLTIRGDFPVTGRPGRLAFTPDGRIGVAYNTSGSGTAVFAVDVVTRGPVSSASANSGLVQFDKLFPAGNNRAIAWSRAGRTLFDVTLSPLSIAPLAFSNLTPVPPVEAVTVSDEVLPGPRYVYFASANQLYRADITGSAALVSPPAALQSTPAGEMGYTAPASTSPAASIISIRGTQTVAPGGLSQPFVLRALDQFGRPAANQAVRADTQVSSLTVQSASATTDSEGYATLTLQAPQTAGSYTLAVAIGTATTTLSLAAGSTGGGSGGTGDTGLLRIISGNGQVVQAQFPGLPMVVQVRNAQGTPQANASVTFAVSGFGSLSSGAEIGSCTTDTAGTPGVLVCPTDANGNASVVFRGDFVNSGSSSQISNVTATSGAESVSFIVTTVINNLPGNTGSAPLPLVTVIRPTLDNLVITGAAGSTVPGAVQVQVVLQAGSEAGRLLSNVGVRVLPGTAGAPSAQCVGGTVLTGTDGRATCDLILGPVAGQAPLVVEVGGYFQSSLPFSIQVTPSTVNNTPVAQIVSGNNQTGTVAQRVTNPLVVRVANAAGTALPGTQVTFQVLTPNLVTLSNVSSTADASGQVSAVATFTNTPGQAQVRVTAGTSSVTFTLTSQASVPQQPVPSRLIYATNAQGADISGNLQTATAGAQFDRALTVQLLDQNNQPVANVPVTFTVASGPARVTTATVNTSAQGFSSTTVQAGNAPGASVITASAAGFSVTFSLTTLAGGPVITAANFLNAASFQQGITPGGLITISAAGIAPGVQGVVTANTVVGPLPTQLVGVEVRFNNILAPILSVSNVNGQEQVSVQVPYEVGAGTATASISINGQVVTVPNLTVLPVQPGIFETSYNNRRTAVLIRQDGSFVTPDNPARRGEIVRLFATGLGQTATPTGTNRFGVAGNPITRTVVVGVNNAGARVISAEYLPGAVGVAVVTFEVPLDAAPIGLDRPLALALLGDGGNLIFGNGSIVPIQ